MLRLLLFAVLFFAVQQLLAIVLLASSQSDAVMLDTTATLAAALLVGAVLLRALEHRPVADLGLPLERQAGRQIGIGTAIGAGGLMVACVLLLAVGTLRYESEPGTVAGWLGGTLRMLLLLLVPAAAEEVLFRGYAFQKLVEGFGGIFATVAASAAFAFAHIHNPSVNGFALANIFAAGVMLSIAFLRTRSLWFAIGVHTGWNWAMAAPLDLPVSGLELFNAPLYEPVDRGPKWLSGGAFGPEAGLAGLLGLLLVLAGVFWTTRKSDG